MKAGWEVKPLSTLCVRVSVGHVGPTSQHYCEGGVPFLRTQNIGEDGLQLDDYKTITSDFHASLKKSQLLPGDLLLSRVITDVMKCGIVPIELGEANCANMILVRPAKDLLPEFLNYLIKSPVSQEYLLGKRVGSAQQVVNTGILKAWPIPIPPLEEQKQIVAVLDAAFEGLTRAKENAEANLQSARELFGSATDQVFASSGDWSQVAIQEFGEVFDGPHATPKTVDEGPLFLGISSLVDGRIELTKTRHVTETDFQKWTKRVVPRQNDVVFAYETRLGQIGLIPEGMKCCLGRRMGLVRLDETKIRPEYFVLCYLSPRFQRFIAEKTVKGATVDRISVKDFPSFPFPLPDIESQDLIIENLHAIRKQHDHLLVSCEVKLTDITDLRQSLLQKAFAGELTGG